MKKVFTTAPLPFMGQKRKFLKEFKAALRDYPADATYVDLFGGSGLLSHTVKSFYPESNVIYNDFDNYRERLENVAKTNALIDDVRNLLIGSAKDKKVSQSIKKEILERVKQEEIDNNYVDYITLSSSILFSMKYVKSFEELTNETFYNCVRQSAYTTNGYLDGLNVVSKCYKELYNDYKDLANVVFLVDPPYLSTDVGTYKGFWKLRDYLDVLEVLNGNNYFYFTSHKSSIIELCDWIETKTPLSNPFKGATTATMNATVNYNSSYTDIMLYKNV